jgi:hypothetical protein
MAADPLDPFVVPDADYEPVVVKQPDRFAGYRALDADDYTAWQQAMLDAES